MYVLEHEINSKELLSQCTSKQVVTRDKQKSCTGQETRGEVIWTPYAVISYLGQSTRNSGRQRLPDSGKTHCNWVSPCLQLYFQDLEGAGLMLSPAPNGASKYLL